MTADIEDGYREVIEKLNNSPLGKDFAKSLYYSMWQYSYLQNAASALIKENNLDPKSRDDIVNTLIRLLEAVP